jgi:uncharacterized phiE125 gp8 family phage protein
MYPLVTVVDTEPTVEPITLTEAKEQLRIDHSDHDTMITGLIQAAREHIESMCARAIVQQTRVAYFDQWPGDKVFHLLYPEIRSITHIKYTDSAGTQTTYSSDNYNLDPGSEPGRVVRGYGKTWPTVTLNNEDYPIEIKYVCGYAPDESASPTDQTGNVPERIKVACRLLTVSFYGGMPEDYSRYRDTAVENLLRPYRVWRN